MLYANLQHYAYRWIPSISSASPHNGCTKYQNEFQQSYLLWLIDSSEVDRENDRIGCLNPSRYRAGKKTTTNWFSKTSPMKQFKLINLSLDFFFKIICPSSHFTSDYWVHTFILWLFESKGRLVPRRVNCEMLTPNCTTHFRVKSQAMFAFSFLNIRIVKYIYSARNGFATPAN